jgi:hypothetical protein
MKTGGLGQVHAPNANSTCNKSTCHYVGCRFHSVPEGPFPQRCDYCQYLGQKATDTLRGWAWTDGFIDLAEPERRRVGIMAATYEQWAHQCDAQPWT